MKPADRPCCDGLCQMGYPCPQVDARERAASPLVFFLGRPGQAAAAKPEAACQQPFAPGVIDGPHRARTRAALFLALVDRVVGLPKRKEAGR